MTPGQRKKDRLASLEASLREIRSQSKSCVHVDSLLGPVEDNADTSVTSADLVNDTGCQELQSFTNNTVSHSADNANALSVISDGQEPVQNLAMLDSALFEDLVFLETSQHSFSDDYSLAVPELECMNTACAFAKLLKCEGTIWDMKCTRILQLPQHEIATLPEILRPTNAQKYIPHHPMIDVIPWPSVRSKLICAFSQPLEMRPLNLRDDMALLRLTYDLDDPAEGVRVSGSDRTDLANWEIGQQLFQNWWWAFDHSIIAISTRKRASRGAAKLRIV
jgi:hypothetical protein